MLTKKKKYVVAVVGATGAVGNEMIATLEESAVDPTVVSIHRASPVLNAPAPKSRLTVNSPPETETR